MDECDFLRRSRSGAPTAIFSPGAHMVDEVILILDLTIYERGEAPSSTTPSGNAKTSPGKVQ